MSEIHWLHHVYPKFVLLFSFSATIYYATRESYTFIPNYPRTVLFFFSCFNLMGGLAHWLLKPSGGLEKIARLKLTSKSSVEKSMMQFLIGEDGIHRTFISFLIFYSITNKTELTMPLLLWTALYQASKVLTSKFYKRPPTLKLKNAPGRFRNYVQNYPVILCCLYAYWTGDLVKYW